MTSREHHVLLDEYGELIADVADVTYAARVDFLCRHADGYAEDTIYSVDNDRYLYWPARTNGYFEGFNDLTPGEQRGVDRLEDAGFEFLGNGIFRIVLAAPAPHDDLVVKIGRGGPNRRHYNGRWENMTEALLSLQSPTGSVLPCLHCTLSGAYSVYPRVDATLDDFGFDGSRRLQDVDSSEPLREVGELAVDGEDLAAFQERLGQVYAEHVEDPGRVQMKNAGMLDGELHVLDVNTDRSGATVVGLPLNIDAKAVVEEVNALRAAGEKMDVEEGGGLVEPDI